MGGPNGVGLGNNVQPIVNPGIANAGNVDGVQPGGVQPGGAPVDGEAYVSEYQVPPRAEEVVGQLDVLLLKALKSVSGKVDVDAVAKAAKEARLDKSVVANLKNLAKIAQDKLTVLDGFSGKDLAAAMMKENDQVVWKDNNDAAKAFEDAQNAQSALSLALADALASAKDGKTQATLEELMFQCDRRSGELESLVIQMTEIIDKGAENAVDEAAKLAGNGKISSHAGDYALDKFGRGEMFNALKGDLKPLAERLEAYAKDGCKNLTKDDLDKCVLELNAIKDKFSAAAAAGKIEIKVGANGKTEIKIGADENTEIEVGEKKKNTKTIFIDRSLLAEATKLLDDVGKKIGSLQREVLRTAMANFVNKDIPFLKEPLLRDKIFSSLFVNELHTLHAGDCQFDKLEQVMTAINSFRHAAQEYAKSPTGTNAWQLKATAQVLANAPCSAAAKCLDLATLISAKPLPTASESFKNAFAEFRDSVCSAASKGRNLAYMDQLIRFAGNIEIAVDRLIGLGKELNAKSGDKYFVSSAVLDVFKGRMSLSTLLESRIHGYADSDVNIALDDKNVVASKTLSGGTFNTVRLVKFKDESEWVFKPELAGRLSAPNSPLNHGLAADQEITRVNLAVQTTADTLGLGDVMVKTSAGAHKGQFGMFMEKAPGMTGSKFKKTGDSDKAPGKVGVADINKMGDADFAKVVGRMMRQFNRMQWFDTITAQGDRHDENYMIDINRKDLTVSIKAIDNDASYGIFRQGLYKFSMPAGSLLQRAFDHTIATWAKTAPTDADKRKMMDSLIFKNPGVQRFKDGSYEIDLEKAKDPALLRGLFQYIGMRNVAPPDEIDSELYDRLVSLAKDAPDGGKARTDYLASLADRLGAGSEAYKAAVNRLDESIAHARKLNDAGKVYSAEQWENHDVQRRIALPNLENMGTKLDTYNISVISKYTGMSQYVNFTNNFFRDMYDKLITGTAHKDWFK